MKKNNKDLLAVYLNEFNFNFLYRGALKYNCLKTLKYLKIGEKAFKPEQKVSWHQRCQLMSVEVQGASVML